MLKLKQYLCRHNDFTFLATHRSTMQNLWQCPKCAVYCIQHWGLGTYYLSKTPHLDGWAYKKEDSNHENTAEER